jgi:hypothetical protein
VEYVAKILGTVAAIERYALQRAGGGELHPAVPADFEVLHACELGPEPWTGWRSFIAVTTEPCFFDGRIAEVVQALCGVRVRILLPKPFDSEDPKACPLCVSEIDREYA